MSSMISRLVLVALFLATPAFATEWVKVTNRSGGTVRVKVWSGVFWKTETLGNGKSFSWKRKSTKDYNATVYRKEGRLVKVWKKQRTLKGIDYSSDIVITKGLAIKPTKARETVIRNGSSKAVVVYVYNGKDDIRLLSKESFTLQPGKSARWKSTQDHFHVKVYELKKGFNRHVGTKVDIPRPASVDITDAGGWEITAEKR